jgi:hypothetical protein
MQMDEQLKAALAPFLEMAKACEPLHDHEPIAGRANGGKIIYLDARDFRALALAFEQQERQKAE